MESSWEEKKAVEEEPLLKKTDKKGGFRTLLPIIANDAFLKMATNALMANLTVYLMNQYNMGMTTASNVLYFWSAATNFLPIVVAIIADSYLGRFRTIGIGSVIAVIGMILLWSTSILPQARPPPCYQSNGTCKSATSFQFMFLCVSLGLISIGAGGMSSSLAFGANQLENGHFQRSSHVKEGYFSWCYASYTFSALIGFTCVVYIQDEIGWGVGLAVPTALMLFGAVSFFLASPFYVKLKSETNLVTGFLQVAIASYRNRHLKLSDDGDTMYHRKSGSVLVSPSRKLRFLNKACVVRDREKDLSRDGTATNPWSLCTVDQVEELKALLKVIPIWSTGMIMSVNRCQSSIQVLQAASMDRRVTSNFTIPEGSFNTFNVVSVIIWIVVYDRVFLPLASRAMKRSVHISTRTRMGIGIFLSLLAMVVTTVVEHIRRGLRGAAMSAMWLVPQYCLSGMGEASNNVAQNEFYFSEFPRSMLSTASTLDLIGMSLASLLASLILNVVDSISKAGGHESWISSDINNGHYDYYYMFITGLTVANMIYYLVCSNAYGPFKEEEDFKIGEEEDEL